MVLVLTANHITLNQMMVNPVSKLLVATANMPKKMAHVHRVTDSRE